MIRYDKNKLICPQCGSVDTGVDPHSLWFASQGRMHCHVCGWNALLADIHQELFENPQPDDSQCIVFWRSCVAERIAREQAQGENLEGRVGIY